MPKLYFEIIDECIDKFRLDEHRTFNFSLLDFRDEVFHNYGLKPPLEPAALTLLLEHAQEYVRRFGMRKPAVQKITDYLYADLKNLPPADEKVREIYQVLFEGRPASTVTHLNSNHIARFVGFLPLKHYWDNSGLIYQRVCEDETSFSKVYLCQYCYDEQHSRPAEVLCREIEIPQHALNPDLLELTLSEFHEQKFHPNAEYFGLRNEDQELYELYGPLFDMLNWGPSNLETVMNYFESRSKELSFYNCVFPLVLHGIYYGIAYFDLPPDFFRHLREAAETLSRMLVKGWTYVHHYFPAIIIDAYNSRMLARFTRGHVDSTEDVVRLVNSKVPFRFCYDRNAGVTCFFKFTPGGINKELCQIRSRAGMEAHDPSFLASFEQLDAALTSERLYAVSQEILGYDLVFLFDMASLPGKEKCKPILDSHIGQAAFVLQTMKDQGERKVYEERKQLLDMIAHDTKTMHELLIADLQEGMDSDLAALQLEEQHRKERMMWNYLLSQPSKLGEEASEPEEEQPVRLAELFVEAFMRTWRAWLKNRRYRASFRRNRSATFALDGDSPRHEVAAYLQANMQSGSASPEAACLAILRDSFRNFSPYAQIRVEAPPMRLVNEARVRIEAILYNLFSNYFKHAAPSPLTGCHECTMIFSATPSAGGAHLHFEFSNSTSLKERFAEEGRARFRLGHEMHGLQIIKYLIENDAGERPPKFKIRHENYMWHLEIGRECRGCKEDAMVHSDS